MSAMEQDRVSGARPEEPECSISKKLLDEFEKHSSSLRERARARRNAVQLKSVVNDKEEREQVSESDSLGRRQPQDEYQGDVNMRTLRQLLKMIDEKGFERSPHQMKFHSAFERSTARVLYKDDWGTQRPAIMKKNGWDKCSSEVLISTPRRFGKTFSIAIFAACLALTMKCEIVVFSPARRASRKLLERMIEVRCYARLYPGYRSFIHWSTSFSIASTLPLGKTGRGALPALYFSSSNLYATNHSFSQSLRIISLFFSSACCSVRSSASCRMGSAKNTAIPTDAACSYCYCSLCGC